MCELWLYKLTALPGSGILKKFKSKWSCLTSERSAYIVEQVRGYLTSNCSLRVSWYFCVPYVNSPVPFSFLLAYMCWHHMTYIVEKDDTKGLCLNQNHSILMTGNAWMCGLEEELFWRHMGELYDGCLYGHPTLSLYAGYLEWWVGRENGLERWRKRMVKGWTKEKITRATISLLN